MRINEKNGNTVLFKNTKWVLLEFIKKKFGSQKTISVFIKNKRRKGKIREIIIFTPTKILSSTHPELVSEIYFLEYGIIFILLRAAVYLHL